MARPNDTRMPGKLEVSAVEVRLSPDVREILWLVERSGGRDGAWGVDWRRRRDPGAGQFAAEDPRISSICLVVWKEKKWGLMIMAREQAELWKTRDNGGKAA